MTATPDQIPGLLAAYRDEHPDVDWATHMVTVRKTDAGYQAIGHQPRDPQIDAILDRCCCHPDQPRGHTDQEQP